MPSVRAVCKLIGAASDRRAPNAASRAPCRRVARGWPFVGPAAAVQAILPYDFAELVLIKGSARWRVTFITGPSSSLRKLWAEGHSAGQIATQLDTTRSAVCAKLNRLGLNRNHRPPTAKPKIVAVPKRPATTDRSLTRQPTPRVHYTRRQLYAMLAEAVRNTG
jgi:GcrA cell cycle regulator